jgi:type IV pilus assembly protein PilE
MKRKFTSGFSLIELMIVLAIIGILAGIAYPTYMDYILKGRRAEGRAALLELLQQQERYMTQNNTYFAFSNLNGVTTPSSTPFKTFSGDSVTNTAYYLSATACPSTTIKECVLVAAEPIQSDPATGTLQILSTGTKTCTGSNSALCWK